MTDQTEPELTYDGYEPYGLFAPDRIAYHGAGWWTMPSTGSHGSARFSSEYDCNPVCGCHLASKCGTCNVCTDCDGCYCYED